MKKENELKSVVLKEVHQHILGHNKYMTMELLNVMDTYQLMAEVHPSYRDEYIYRLSNAIDDTKEQRLTEEA